MGLIYYFSQFAISLKELFGAKLRVAMLTLSTSYVAGITSIIVLGALQGCGYAGEQCVECAINAQETITTMQLKMVAAAVSPDTLVFTYRDIDLASGPNLPTIDSLRLLPNTYYSVIVLLYNEQKNPPENISKEVRFEGDQHQLFYEPIPNDILTTTYKDADDESDPLGLAMAFTTGLGGNGSLAMTLKHQPTNKNGQISNGDTDILVVWPLVVSP